MLARQRYDDDDDDDDGFMYGDMESMPFRQITIPLTLKWYAEMVGTCVTSESTQNLMRIGYSPIVLLDGKKVVNDIAFDLSQTENHIVQWLTGSNFADNPEGLDLFKKMRERYFR